MSAERLMHEIETLPKKDFDKIVKFVDQLKFSNGVSDSMLMSEAAWARDWDCPEEDEAWAHL